MKCQVCWDKENGNARRRGGPKGEPKVVFAVKGGALAQHNKKKHAQLQKIRAAQPVNMPLRTGGARQPRARVGMGGGPRRSGI